MSNTNTQTELADYIVKRGWGVSNPVIQLTAQR